MGIDMVDETTGAEWVGEQAGPNQTGEPYAIDMTRAYAGLLMPEEQAWTFRNTHQAFATRTIRRGEKARPMNYAPRRLRSFPIHSGTNWFDLYDYVSRNRVAGLIVQQAGQVLLEHYELGLAPHERWMSMSMAKSVSTVLVGAAVRDGYIGDIDWPLVTYLPELAGTAYDGVSIRELMQMTSGAKWDDTHTDPASERRHMLALQLQQQPGAIMRLMGSLERAAAPGAQWNYSTGETHVVGALLKAATGRWLADYLSERIWSRLGMEADAFWWLEAPAGLEVAGSGICATLRDYARFAEFVLADGVIDSERILPEGWVGEMTAPRKIGGEPLNYGFMWWPVPAREGSLEDRAFSARGIFGQYIYVNPRHEIVIVVLSARSKPKGAEAIPDNDFFNAAVSALIST